VHSTAGLAVCQGPSGRGDPPDGLAVLRGLARSDVCPDMSGRRPSDVIFPKDVQCDRPVFMVRMAFHILIFILFIL
jgi:hypothetical protein